MNEDTADKGKRCKENERVRPEDISLVNRVSLFVDAHKQAISYGFYAVGLAGLYKIGISLRAFEKFRKVKRIDFI